MAYNPKYNKSVYEYKKKRIKRVPFDLQKDYFEEVVKPAAECRGLAINAFIKEAIAEKIERMTESGDFF